MRRGRRDRPLAFAAAIAGLVGGCTPFDEFAGSDAGTHAPPGADASLEGGGAQVDAAGVDVTAEDARGDDVDESARDASDGATCVSPWASSAPGAACGRQLVTVLDGLGAVSILRLSPAFAGELALLYDERVDGSSVLTLSLVDPASGSIAASRQVAGDGPFDDAALAYDGVGTLAVAYHASAGGPIAYVTASPSLVLSPEEDVVSSATTARLALAPIVEAPDADVPEGGLGPVEGTMGLAWYLAPPTLEQPMAAALSLYARGDSGWAMQEEYLDAPVTGGIDLRASAPGDEIVGALSPAPTDGPVQACVWHMDGHRTSCVFPSTLYGLSLVTSPGATRLVYAYDAPGSSLTTLNVATDTDGSGTFGLLSTVTTFADALSGAAALPRAQSLAPSEMNPTLAIAVAYPGADFAFRIDYLTWDTAGLAGTVERVTTVASTGATPPPFDLAVDAAGAADVAFFDPASGAIELARALPAASGGEP